MRTLLIFSTAIAFVLCGCATQDPNAPAAPAAVTPSDASLRPGSGPGAQPSSGMPLNTGPQ